VHVHISQPENPTRCHAPNIIADPERAWLRGRFPPYGPPEWAVGKDRRAQPSLHFHPGGSPPAIASDRVGPKMSRYLGGHPHHGLMDATPGRR
jgi:hypothetical protein